MSIQKDFWYKIEDSVYDEEDSEDLRRIRSHVMNEVEEGFFFEEKYKQLEFEFEDDFNLTEDLVAPI